MRQQYAVRSLFLVFCFALVGVAILAQMIRIQNSEQASIFLSQGDLYAASFTPFTRSAARSTTATVICLPVIGRCTKWA
ncbi:MAG: hypothetical protein U0X87_04035 [Anaerolineales bacterium]